jgi:hypothetical protein
MLRTDDVKQIALDVVKDFASSPTDKTAARKAIRRAENRAERTNGLPKRPKRKHFASDTDYEQALKEFRSVLDRAAVVREASKVLDDPTASVHRRKNAHEALYGPDPEPEPVKTSQAPEKPLRSRLSAAESVEERARAQAFLDSIGQPDIQPQVEVPAPTVQAHVPTKPKPERWCHVHAASLDVCRCDANETCPLCLMPRPSCYIPCQNAIRRR